MDLKRRDFLKLVGGATVATTLPGCGIRKPQSLIPYVVPEENIVPGKAVWYASVCQECPAGCGVTVRVREGRAVKVEGNPLHPVNEGGLCARGQASLQGLYNPDRIRQPMRKKFDGSWEHITWEEAERYLVSELLKIQSKGGAPDVVFMTGHLSGSTDRLVDQWLNAIGSRKRYRYEPFAHESIKRANAEMFGIPQVPVYDFARAETVISFGADFLETWISPVGYTKGFSKHRGYKNGKRGASMYVGPRLSLTATNADEWIPVPPGSEGVLALGLVNVLLTSHSVTHPPQEVVSAIRAYSPQAVARMTGLPKDKIEKIGRILSESRSSLAVTGGTVVEGDGSLALAAAVNLLNYVLGNIGSTVRFADTSISNLNSYREIARLTDMMNADGVPAFIFSGVNPVFTTPASLDFDKALEKVPLRVALSSTLDETSSLANLVLPVHAPLESWGDTEIERGVHGLQQPVMQSVFQTRMFGDILLETGKSFEGFEPRAASMYEYLRERWRGIRDQSGEESDFEMFWIESLARGGYWRPSTPRTAKFSSSFPVSIFDPLMTRPQGGKGFFLIVYPSINYYDGRNANRPWMQELPDPMTMNVWDNWIEIHPDDAAAAGITTGDAVQVSSPYGRFDLPAQVTPAVRQGTAAIPIGQGHTSFGRFASSVGKNPIDLLDPKPSELTHGLVWAGLRVEILKRPGEKMLVSVSGSDTQHDREVVRTISPDELGRRSSTQELPSMYQGHDHPKHRWGMAIDIDKCTGCSACVTACYAENNIPVVGKKEVHFGREMAWIRIERFFDEDAGTTHADFAPMLCQQCDNAPCETVCPVYAAYHTEEGLNGQVYNRCIGTRYCANNCPYKVRRFNWWQNEWIEPLNWQLNPDVTVRSKGVMEKCTFCIQRIKDGENSARAERRNVGDGEITPACAQSCPADAITFGDLKDPDSKVSRLIIDEGVRGYKVLEELNTQPAVTYLKAIKKLPV